MAGKKKEGLGALKDTTGGNRRDDRQVVGKSVFEPISIDARNALTVIYMLKSPEDNVVLRAVASLEGFARKSSENMKLLSSLGIFEYLLPLVQHEDNIVKRFSQKLIGMLCSLEEFREQMLQVENILITFVDVLQKEMDVVMHEYSALTLAELSNDYHAASELLNVENCIETLFLRITSADPDVEKNCLDIMNHLLNYVTGVEVFIESPGFDIKLLLDLIPSSYPAIQSLAIEVLKQLTSWCRDSRVLIAFRDAMGVDITLDILENEEWPDLHVAGLDLLINVVDNPDLCDYLLQSGCLLRLIKLLDTVGDKTSVVKILGVLARMSQTHRGRLALHSMEMDKRFSTYLKENEENIQEPACLGIANLAQHGPCLENIMAENPTPYLLDITTDPQKNLNLRTLAAYTLSILCNECKTASEALLESQKLENLFDILVESSELPVELCKNVIQIFMGISFDDKLRVRLIRESFIYALLSCLNSGDGSQLKDASLQVDSLECLSAYLIEWEARSIFELQDGTEKLIECLHSKYASVREWAGHLVVVVAQSKEFVRNFIQKDGLEWMIREKNTIYSMPSWQSAIDAIFANFLPAKFAYTGRLDFQDITQDGFYIASQARVKFLLLENVIEARLCPIFPIYVANFQRDSNPSYGDSEKSSSKSVKYEKPPQQQPETPQNLQKFMKGADRNSQEEYKWTGSLNTYPSLEYSNSAKSEESTISDYYGRYIPDPFLAEYLENLKQRIASEESYCGDANWSLMHPKLVKERARIIAEFVVDEMSGPEPDPVCSGHYKEMHINEMKYHLETNIIPLGFIRMGDYLERAMLFKVLSDRIGFPCALVRGQHGRAWIEIAVPVINIEDTGNSQEGSLQKRKQTRSDSKIYSRETFQTTGSLTSNHESNYEESLLQEESFWFPKVKMDCFKPFPSNFLKPNAIVDLIDVPGRILKINSFEAEEYRGTFLFGKCL